MAESGRKHSAFSSVCLSPDARILVTGDYDGKLRVWERSSGKEITRLIAHGPVIDSVAFSPDGKLLIATSLELVTCHHVAKTWNVSWAERGAPTFGESKILDTFPKVLRFSPDGKWLANSSRSIEIWNVETGQKHKEFPESQITYKTLCFSPDGKMLVWGGSEGLIRGFHTATWEQSLEIMCPGERIYSLAFSPDGKRIASATTDRILNVWDVETRRPIFHHPVQIAPAEPTLNYEVSVAFTHDGQRLLGADGAGDMWMWEASTGTEIYHMERGKYGVHDMAVSEDGTVLVTVGDRKAFIWQVNSKGLELLRALDDKLAY